MTWPTRQPGLVIRYAYLWQREALAGQEEGVKDRPCAVIVARTDSTIPPRQIPTPQSKSRP